MYRYIKRILDILFSLILLIPSLPIVLVAMLCIRLESKGGALLRQTRSGINRKPFTLYKLRTMYVSAPSSMPTHMLENPEALITKVGRFLRKASIDELPQLFNILRGDMSLIGPRPALLNQTDLLDLRDLNGANAVLPGLTGWAQVHGRDELSIEDKAALDGQYAHRLGFKIDFLCVFMTIRCVVLREGYVEGKREAKWDK